MAESGPAELKLPPRVIMRPRSSGWPFLSLATAVLGVFGSLCAFHVTSVGLCLVLAIAIVAVVAPITIAIVYAIQKKRIEHAIATLPPGSFYQAPASLKPTQGAGILPKSGRILLDAEGVKWTKSKETVPSLATTWDRVGRIVLGPAPGKLRGVGLLSLELSPEQSCSFEIIAPRLLAEILNRFA